MAALLAAPAVGARQAPPAAPEPATGTASFVVLLRGAVVGSETSTVARTAAGWTISANNRLDPPLSLTTSRFEMTYGPDWHPQQLSAEGVLRGQPMSLMTSFGLTTATNEVMQGANRAANSQQISARTVVLPGNFFASYEALAARLTGATPGTRVPVYVAPAGEAAVTVERVTPRQLKSGDAVVDIREFALTMVSSTGPVPLEIWADSRNRLARVVMPTASLVVVRSDLAGVMVRENRMRNPGDDDAFIPGIGFNLASTITRPPGAIGRAPAVILVSSPGPQDRDFFSYGVSIHTEIAAALSKAGMLVVRYDGRGVGQSGGRTESAALAEYAGDVRAIVNALRKRGDVDPNRIGIVGYGDAGPIALLTASAEKEKRVRSVALVNAPGRNGRDVTMEQQRLLLSLLPMTEADRSAKLTLQSRIIDAAVKNSGWETLPQEIRAQADSPWFRSWLLFDPATIVAKLKQPILILHGLLDRQTPPAHADELERVALSRKNLPSGSTKKVVVAGVNHLLVTARTGEISEYPALESRTLAPEATDSLVAWFKDTLQNR